MARKWIRNSLANVEYEHRPQVEIMDGEMDSRVGWLRDPDGCGPGDVDVSIFRAEPSFSRTIFPHNETVYIIEGRSDVEIDGETFSLNAGDFAYFRQGVEATLRVHESIAMFIVESGHGAGAD